MSAVKIFTEISTFSRPTMIPNGLKNFKVKCRHWYYISYCKFPKKHYWNFSFFWCDSVHSELSHILIRKQPIAAGKKVAISLSSRKKKYREWCQKPNVTQIQYDIKFSAFKTTTGWYFVIQQNLFHKLKTVKTSQE